MHNAHQKDPCTESGSASLLSFALAILSGAVLLFLVQPMIAKFILPWFGGSPAVWTTCMLFFQLVLFGGYLYGHAVQRYLHARGQAVLHLGLVVAALAVLPISASERWKPSGSSSPTAQILLLLLSSVGLPYFVLAATSPLVQAWFSHRHPTRSPYRLYALSNAGSIAALVGYPFLIEPNLDVRQQSWLWSAGFLVYATACGFCLASLWKLQNQAHRNPGQPPETGELIPGTPSHWQRFLWVFLPATASVVLLATTNQVCQNIAVVPFLWIVPLTLYLITFIIAFEYLRGYVRPVWATLAALAILAVLLYNQNLFRFGLKLQGTQELVLDLAAMFLACMVCHGELVRSRPAPERLTEFYLMLAAGGALGGVFVTLVAPRVFDSYREWPIGLLLSFGIAIIALTLALPRGGWGWIWRSAVLLPAAISLTWIVPSTSPPPNVVAQARNFYGITKVLELSPDDPVNHCRMLQHGSIRHGTQFLDPDRSWIPTDYYTQQTGVAQTIAQLSSKGPIRVGVIGLGIGTLAAYARPVDFYCFYEINPEVVRMANQYFTYLGQSAGQCETVLGDARLSLETESPRNFDLLVLDAFSSDAIPTHLLTREAFQIYARHLKPAGVIAAHITNKFLDLSPVVRAQADALKFGVREVIVQKNEQNHLPYTNWMILTTNQELLSQLPLETESSGLNLTKLPLWTDFHSNLFAILRWR